MRFWKNKKDFATALGQIFSKSLKDVTNTKKRKNEICDALDSAVWCTQRSQLHHIYQKTPRCASHRRVELCCVLPTTETDFVVCIPPQSQAPQCIPLKSRAPWCDAHRGVEFFDLCDQISRQNRNWIQKYFSLFIRGLDGFESWKKLEVKNLLTHSL